eukprot:262686-Chlamydomonas_euryale.AAC.3
MLAPQQTCRTASLTADLAASPTAGRALQQTVLRSGACVAAGRALQRTCLAAGRAASWRGRTGREAGVHRQWVEGGKCCVEPDTLVTVLRTTPCAKCHRDKCHSAKCHRDKCHSDKCHRAGPAVRVA